MGQVRFEKQHYGAVVATILETDNSIVEVQEHNDGVYGLIIHTRRYDRDHWDDPDLETDVGQCPDCSGDGCADSDEPVSKTGRSEYWMRSQIISILNRNRS